MYQQSSFLVITSTLFGLSVRRHHLFVVMPQYGALINNLVVTTDGLIMGSGTAPLSQSSSQNAKLRIDPAPLAWSGALRVSRDISIKASNEYAVCLSKLISFMCSRSQDWAKP